MKLGCPVCGSKYHLSDFVHEAGMKELIDLAARFGTSFHLVYSYTECFREGQWGSVGLEKKIRILNDVDKLLASCEFEYDGKRYRTDRAKILAGIRAIVDADRHGFRNHNYLKAILLGQRPQRLSAEGMTAKEEERKIASLKDRTAALRSAALEDKGVTAAEYKRRKGLESLVDAIGAGKQ